MTVQGIPIGAQPPFKIRVQVLGAGQTADNVVVEGTTRGSRSASLRQLTGRIGRICSELSRLGHSNDEIAAVLDVDTCQVVEWLSVVEMKRQKAATASRKVLLNLSVRYPVFEEVLHLFLPSCSKNDRVMFTLFDKNRGCLGDTSMDMDHLICAPNHKLYGPFNLHANVDLVGSIQLKWLR